MYCRKASTVFSHGPEMGSISINMFKLAVIIATNDRAFELDRLLNSIKDQDILPQEIIIVDAGTLPNFSLNADARQFGSLKIKRVKATRACLPAQRNQGLALLGRSE